MTTLRRGTNDWWAVLAIKEATENYRKENKLSPESKAVISVEEVNDVIHRWSIFKRIWLLLTNGDIKELDLGQEFEVKR